ncbi:MAG: hypothetical protein ACRDL7_00670, partial [Gaiellaceae bacterium]
MAKIPDRPLEVIICINYATYLQDPTQSESLFQPFQSLRHGVTFDLTPLAHGGNQEISVEGEKLRFEYDGEKLFWKIRKPVQEDFDKLEWFELTSPYPDDVLPRRTRKKTTPDDIPITEWRKRLAMLPEDVIRRTLENTTQFYLSLEAENRDDPKGHVKSRMPGLRWPRQNEIVCSDTYFPSIPSDRGNTCSQIFVGDTSDRWETYPMKTENQNGIALQDYTRQHGCPNIIMSDNAQSQIGQLWTNHCRTHCICSKTTEPHQPQQNKAERRIQDLNRMVRVVMRTSKAPLGKHDWCQKWCCDIHNHTSNRKLGWRTPFEVNTGHTPDISMFRFYFWEPIWYLDPKIKAPLDRLKKARFLGLAHNSGDALTYYIETEKTDPESRNVILVRSVIKSRRKYIGQTEEYINDNPQYADFFLTSTFLSTVTENVVSTSSPNAILGEIDMEMEEEKEIEMEEGTEGAEIEQEDSQLEQLPPDLDNLPSNKEAITSMYDHFEMEESNSYEFDKIVDHKFDDGVLKLRVQYRGEDNDHFTDVPFDILSKDNPFELAKYI